MLYQIARPSIKQPKFRQCGIDLRRENLEQNRERKKDTSQTLAVWQKWHAEQRGNYILLSKWYLNIHTEKKLLLHNTH